MHDNVNGKAGCAKLDVLRWLHADETALPTDVTGCWLLADATTLPAYVTGCGANKTRCLADSTTLMTDETLTEVTG